MDKNLNKRPGHLLTLKWNQASLKLGNCLKCELIHPITLPFQTTLLAIPSQKIEPRSYRTSQKPKSAVFSEILILNLKRRRKNQRILSLIISRFKTKNSRVSSLRRRERVSEYRMEIEKGFKKSEMASHLKG